MKIQISIQNEFGEFLGEVLEITEEQYENVKNLSKSFYESGFELTDKDGNFIVFSPEIVKKSILKISIINETI